MSLKNNPILKSSKIRVALTIGDPAGIGPAITLRALKLLKNKAEITVIGDRRVLSKAAKLLPIALEPIKLIDLNNVKDKKFRFGVLSASSGRASMEYLDQARELIKKDQVDCLVTCPISKEAINLAGFNYSGHTEYFAKKYKCRDLVMMLLNDKLRFSLLTRHIRLREVCRKITAQNLETNIINTVKGLKNLFLIKTPRLVVCGVNPHASDNGVIGTEERDMIMPVIKRLNKKLCAAALIGPVLGADVAIAQAAKGKFDCVIAPYHDQALIALKLTGFDSGVNLTLGLPFIRTSPLHGVAFDIANQPALANPDSLISAIRLAIKCQLNQKKA